MKKTIFAVSLALLSSVSFADVDKGYFAGIQMGSAQPGLSSGSIGVNSVDNSDFSYGFSGGYKFNKYFAVEGRYSYLGSYDWKLGTAKGSFDAQAFDVSAVGFLPVHRQVSLMGRIGIANTRYDKDLDGTRNDLVYGIGVSYSFMKNWSAETGYDWYNKFGDSDDTLGNWHIGLKHHF